MRKLAAIDGDLMTDGFAPAAAPANQPPIRPAAIVREIRPALYRNRFLILAIMAVALLAGLASILLTPAVYRAEATVEVQQQTARILESDDVEPTDTNSAEAARYLQTQIEIVESRRLAAAVAESLALPAQNGFLKAMGQATPANGDMAARTDLIVDLLQANVSAEVSPNTEVMRIAFTGRDPAWTAKVANSYVDNFVRSNIGRRAATSSYSLEFLQSQLDEAQDRLEQSERNLVDYARAARLVDVGSDASSDDTVDSTTVTNLSELNTAYAQAQTRRIEAEQTWYTARATPLMSMPQVIGNQTIQTLQQASAEQLATLTALRGRYGPDHPTLLRAQQEYQQTEDQIELLAGRIRTSIRSDYQTAQQQEQQLGDRVAQLQDATLGAQDRGIRYNILRREVETSRALYESLLNRFKEVRAASGIVPNNIAPLDAARVPGTPVRPRPAMNMVLAVLGGIFLSLAAVVLRETIDDTVRDPADFEARLGIPALGFVPYSKTGASLIGDRAGPDTDLAEAYNSIRAAIELSLAGGVPKSLLVTSARQGEGKSTLAASLAYQFSEVGRKVLLIDADLRRPSQHIGLGQDAEPGLSNLLTRQVAPAEAIRATAHPALSFMPAGSTVPNPAQLVGSPALKHLIASLQSEYELLIIDGPPLLALADALHLSTAIEGTILAIESGAVHYGQARRLIDRLDEMHANIIGGVLTKFNARSMGYGYEAGLGYGYRT